MKHEVNLCKINIYTLVCLMVIPIVGSCISAHGQTSSPAPKGRLGADKSGDVVKITQDRNLWWFNGETPPIVNGHYNTTATLSVKGITGAFQWQINGGSDKAGFLINSVSGNTIKIKSTNASGQSSKVNKDIIIRVVQNGKTLATFKTVVYAPYRLRQTFVGTKATDYGYETLIRYQIQNQFLQPLPEPVPLNEQFTSASVPDFPGENWRGGLGVTTQGGHLGHDGGLLYDAIEGEESTRNPAPVSPKWATGAGTKVQHWTGVWNIGSEKIGRGLEVTSLQWGGKTYCIWQKYRGYAHHE